MSNAVVTHFMNSGNNRYLSLNFTQTGNHITATLPSDSITLPPGIYMLFVMVDDIPSVAEILQIQSTTVTSVNQITNGNQQLQIFPNPTSDFITLNFPNKANNSQLEIFNTFGETILKTQNKNTIDVSDFANGIYFISVKTGNNWYSQKFIKQ